MTIYDYVSDSDNGVYLYSLFRTLSATKIMNVVIRMYMQPWLVV